MSLSGNLLVPTVFETIELLVPTPTNHLSTLSGGPSSLLGKLLTKSPEQGANYLSTNSKINK